ncbi:MAG: serine hydrolase domain-containing protein [Pseudomonadota bacterium]
MRNAWLLLAFISIVTGCASQQQKAYNKLLQSYPNENFITQINTLIQKKQPRFFNGIILVAKDGDIIYTKAQGYANFETKKPLALDDRFRIMSNSKQITAVLVLKEAQEGNVDLHIPIKNYLPDLKESWAETVTIHQLLNMSSGIIDLERPLLFEAGTGYRYSNPGYGLLGKIIERVSGVSYSENVSMLFKQLDMKNTYPYQLGHMDSELIDGYWLHNEGLERVDFENSQFTADTWNLFLPAGGIISNAYDLLNWDQKLHSGQILEPSYYQLLTTPTNKGPHAAFDGDTIGYAYGFRVHEQHRTKHLGHGGRGFGFVSIKFFIPEKNISVVVFENIYSRDAHFMSGEVVYFFENEIRKIIVNSNL